MKIPTALSLICGLCALVIQARAEVVDSTLDLEGVTQIELSGPYEVKITQGEPEFVTVTTEKNQLDAIQAKVSGNLLTLGDKNGSRWSWFDFGHNRYPATFTVQVRSLESFSNHGSGEVHIGAIENQSGLEIRNHGSGDIFLEAFAGGDLDIVSRGSGSSRIQRLRAGEFSTHSYGSGNIHADQAELEKVDIGVHGSSNIRISEGRAESVAISIHGSGDVDVEDLIARQAEVSIFGSGDVKVYAGETLDVNVHGSGDVRYNGNPASVSRSVHGSGDVKPR